MIRVDMRPGTITVPVVLAFYISTAASAEALFCTAERASGFIYDPADQSWEVSTLSVEHRQYLVAPANEDNLFARALKYDYEVKDAGSSKPIIHCKSLKYPDSNEETGLIMCKGSFGASFNIDKQSGRYVRAHTGYSFTRQTSAEATEGPYMEIGNCTPK